jgi:uncharacterized protein (UPF0303 family)
MNNTPNITLDLAIISEQEARLQFSSFDNTTAWHLGEAVKKHCESRNLTVTIEVRLCRETVFFYSMLGTSPINADWVRRKRNTTELHQRSSYAVGLALREGETLQSQSGLAVSEYAQHGGSVPIRVKNLGVVGTVTVSGLPQREDHNVVVQAMAALIGTSLASCSLQSSDS